MLMRSVKMRIYSSPTFCFSICSLRARILIFTACFSCAISSLAIVFLLAECSLNNCTGCSLFHNCNSVFGHVLRLLELSVAVLTSMVQLRMPVLKVSVLTVPVWRLSELSMLTMTRPVLTVPVRRR